MYMKNFILISFVLTASAFFAGANAAEAAIRYADGQLAQNCIGNYSIANRSCTGSDGNAYTTIEAAASGLGAGDTIYVRQSGSVYGGSAEDEGVLLSALPAGASGNHFIIQKYPSDSGTVYIRSFRDGSIMQNMTVKNVTINCGNFTQPSVPAGSGSGIINVLGARFENVVVENCWRNAIQFVGSSQFINMTVRFNGWGCGPTEGCPGGAYGVYTGTSGDPNSTRYDNNLFDGGRYHNNKGYGIHCYADCGNTIIRNLRVDHNGTPETLGWGIIMAWKTNSSQISNVVADHNAGVGIGLGPGIQAHNLTAYANDSGNIDMGNHVGSLIKDSIALSPGGGIGGLDGVTNFNNITTGSITDFYIDPANGNFTPLTNNDIGASGNFSASGTGIAGVVPRPSIPSCNNLWNSSLAVPTGFAASFNLFSTAKELLIEAFCGVLGTKTGAQVDVGNGSQLQFIYKTGHIWQNGAWSPFNYSGSAMSSDGNWFIGSASHQFDISSAELANKQSVLAYICDWIPSSDGTSAGKWKCGCSDSTCATPKWNLQQFKK